MASLQEIKDKIRVANEIGRVNLVEKGVACSENATTCEIMRRIADCKTGNDVPDSEGVTFGYEKKTVTNTVTASKGNCFYNGVELPELPADVLKEYPYCWIRENNTSGHYDLFFSNVLLYYLDNDNNVQGTDITKPWYRIEKASVNDATEWIYYKDSVANLGLDSERTALWSNFDIPNGSATSTTIYFEGTEAITSYTTTETVNAPVERKEYYSVKSDDLSEIARRTQEMAGTSKLLTTDDILYWLGRVQYIPQGWASSEFMLGATSNAVGDLPTIHKGVAKCIVNMTVATSAMGI